MSELETKIKPNLSLHKNENCLPLSFSTYAKGLSLIEVKKSKKLFEYPNLTHKKLTKPAIDPRLAIFTYWP